MDAHPPQHPSATLAAFTVPDLSALRALPDADALQTLDAYLWGAAQISSILRERLLHDSKESAPSTSSFHRPGPHVRFLPLHPTSPECSCLVLINFPFSLILGLLARRLRRD